MAGRRGEEKWELVHSALEERQEGLPTRFGASLVRVAVVEAGKVGGRRLADFRLPQIETLNARDLIQYLSPAQT